jgi:ribulose-phosphate 3-epimerase
MREIDLLLIMTVHPGFAGQAFRADVIPKIREARAFIAREALAVQVEVDGGIKADTAAAVAEAGADILVSGSGIFPDHVRENLRRIRDVAERAASDRR